MRWIWIVAMLAMAAGARAGADPIEGVWRTLSDDHGQYGYVRFAQCGSNICGTIVKTFAGEGDERPTPLVGKRVVWDMQPRGDGSYAGGNIWSFEDNRVYGARLQLNGAHLEITGCLVFVCETVGDWTRVP